MTLSDLSGDLLERFFLNIAYFAESVKYTPSGGSPVTIKADVGEETVEQTERAGKKVTLRRRQITASTDAELSCGGIADVAGVIRGKFTYPVSAGRDYSVERVIQVCEFSKIVQVEAVNVEETSDVDPRRGLRDGHKW